MMNIVIDTDGGGDILGILGTNIIYPIGTEIKFGTKTGIVYIRITGYDLDTERDSGEKAIIYNPTELTLFGEISDRGITDIDEIRDVFATEA